MTTKHIPTTPMPDWMRYKVRRWLGYDMDKEDERTLQTHSYLKDWEPATLRPGVVRPDRADHDGGPEFCPSRYKKRGAKKDG